jgi:hypothetical protein
MAQVQLTLLVATLAQRWELDVVPQRVGVRVGVSLQPDVPLRAALRRHTPQPGREPEEHAVTPDRHRLRPIRRT